MAGTAGALALALLAAELGVGGVIATTRGGTEAALARPRLATGACLVESLAPLPGPFTERSAPEPSAPAVQAAVVSWTETRDREIGPAPRIAATGPVCSYDRNTGMLMKVVDE